MESLVKSAGIRLCSGHPPTLRICTGMMSPHHMWLWNLAGFTSRSIESQWGLTLGELKGYRKIRLCSDRAHKNSLALRPSRGAAVWIVLTHTWRFNDYFLGVRQRQKQKSCWAPFLFPTFCLAALMFWVPSLTVSIHFSSTVYPILTFPSRPTCPIFVSWQMPLKGLLPCHTPKATYTEASEPQRGTCPTIPGRRPWSVWVTAKVTPTPPHPPGRLSWIWHICKLDYGPPNPVDHLTWDPYPPKGSHTTPFSGWPH